MLGKIEDRRTSGCWGWDGWMASPTQWTWVWVNSGSWWWTGRPGMLRFMGSQRVGHDWVTELNWKPGQRYPGECCLCKFSVNLKLFQISKFCLYFIKELTAFSILIIFILNHLTYTHVSMFKKTEFSKQNFIFRNVLKACSYKQPLVFLSLLLCLKATC